MTRNQRRALLGFGNLSALVLPLSDGHLSPRDRTHFLGLAYAVYPAAAATAKPMTRNQRRAFFGFGNLSALVLPLADGSLSARDRAHLLGLVYQYYPLTPAAFAGSITDSPLYHATIDDEALS